MNGYVTNSTLPVGRALFTVYKVEGALNVPGYSRHSYIATIPGANAGQAGTITGGTLFATTPGMPVPGGGATVNTVVVNWGVGEVVGTCEVKAPGGGFSVTREVNVVKVQLDAAGADNILKLDPSHQVQRDSLKGVRSSGTPLRLPAMYASIKVTQIAGPLVDGIRRGQRFIDLGFMQTVSVVHLHGDYNDTTPKFRMVSFMEGKTYIDVSPETKDNRPWVRKMYGLFPDINVPGTYSYKAIAMENDVIPATLFDTYDSPEVDAVQNMTVDGDLVDFFSIVLSFDTYFAVHTREETNAANDSYTIRASVHWDWNASGVIGQYWPITQHWVLSLPPGVSTLSSPTDPAPRKLTESFACNIVLTTLTKGLTANDAASIFRETWDRVNQ